MVSPDWECRGHFLTVYAEYQYGFLTQEIPSSSRNLRVNTCSVLHVCPESEQEEFHTGAPSGQAENALPMQSLAKP